MAICLVGGMVDQMTERDKVEGDGEGAEGSRKASKMEMSCGLDWQ